MALTMRVFAVPARAIPREGFRGEYVGYERLVGVESAPDWEIPGGQKYAFNHDGETIDAIDDSVDGTVPKSLSYRSALRCGDISRLSQAEYAAAVEAERVAAEQAAEAPKKSKRATADAAGDGEKAAG